MSSNILIPKICQHCNQGFIAKTTVTKFCSHLCAQRAYKKNKRTEKIVAAQKREWINFTGEDVNTIQNKEYLSIKETCLLLGISRMSLHRYIKNNLIKPSMLGGRIIISRKEIDKSLK